MPFLSIPLFLSSTFIMTCCIYTRYEVLEQMVAHSQYCLSGDYTVKATAMVGDFAICVICVCYTTLLHQCYQHPC